MSQQKFNSEEVLMSQPWSKAFVALNQSGREALERKRQMHKWLHHFVPRHWMANLLKQGRLG